MFTGFVLTVGLDSMRFNIDNDERCKQFLENKGRKCKMPSIIDGYCIIHYQMENGKEDKLRSNDKK